MPTLSINTSRIFDHRRIRMKRYAGYTALAVVLSFGMVTLGYAVDRVGGPQKGETTDPPAASGSEPKAQKAPKPRASDTEMGSKSGTGSESGAGGTQSTPSKMDTGAPGTPGGSGLGTDTGTEKEPKPGSGR
jgi:hypothetical protein